MGLCFCVWWKKTAEDSELVAAAEEGAAVRRGEPVPAGRFSFTAVRRTRRKAYLTLLATARLDEVPRAGIAVGKAPSVAAVPVSVRPCKS